MPKTLNKCFTSHEVRKVSGVTCLSSYALGETYARHRFRITYLSSIGSLAVGPRRSRLVLKSMYNELGQRQILIYYM